MRGPCRQPSFELFGDHLLGWPSDHIRRRALQHDDMRGFRCHRRNDRYRRRAATDHDEPLAVVAQVVRPLLRMHDAASELLRAWPIWRVALRILVVTRAQEEEVARESELLAVGAIDVERPASVLGPPRRPHDFEPETNVAIDAIGFRRFNEIAQDRGSVSDRLRIVPGKKRVAERRHIRVGTNARIAKKVPGAPDRISRFEDGKSRLRPLPNKMAGCSDSRQTGADDKNVEVRTLSADRRGIVINPRRQLPIAHAASPSG
jgi:hypothetical protein